MIAILIALFLLVVISEGCVKDVYGYNWQLTKKRVDAFVLLELELNPFDSSIIQVQDNPYFISTVPAALSAKWYLHGVGTIPRWSKQHRMLNKLHKKLLSER